MISSEKELLEFLKDKYMDAIVVEGYDGVGKGRVLNLLSKVYSVTPYRPDYNLWQKYDHRQKDRWKISGFFWDVYSHFTNIHLTPMTPMLFDRGVMSGAVYSMDDHISESIAKDYKTLLRDRDVLHILVVCDKEDFRKFQEIRSFYLNKDIDGLWEDYEEYTERYRKYFKLAGVKVVEYQNKYSSEDASSLLTTCSGCGHYSYGICRHPSINSKVDPSQLRCSLSNDKESQDREVEKSAEAMQCL